MESSVRPGSLGAPGLRSRDGAAAGWGRPFGVVGADGMDRSDGAGPWAVGRGPGPHNATMGIRGYGWGPIDTVLSHGWGPIDFPSWPYRSHAKPYLAIDAL